MLHGRLRCRKREQKCGAFAKIRFNPDVTAMDLNDPLDKSQPDAGAFDAWVKSVEQAKDAFLIFGLDPYPIIADIEDRLAIRVRSIGADLDGGPWLVAHELDGIADQVLHHFCDAESVDMDDWKLTNDAHSDIARLKRT